MDRHHGVYEIPQEPTFHYFNGPSGEENNGQEEGLNRNTNLYETLIASQPHAGSSKIPGLQTATLELADKNSNMDKAAMLRQKLLASRRTSSRDVTPADNAKNTQLGANLSQAGKRRVSGLEELIRESREAAEKSTKQHVPLDGNVLENQIDHVFPAKPANHTNLHEHANGDINVASATKMMTSPMSNAVEKTRVVSDDVITASPSQVKNGQNIIDKRAPITAHKNVENDNRDAVPTIQSNRAVALRDKIQSQADDAKRGADEANESFQLRPVKQSRGSLTNVSNDETSVSGLDHSILSKYFSDLNEWLEITGYHDLSLRRRTLTRHRRRLQLEQELAQLDQEDEEDRNVASRSGPVALLPPAWSNSSTRATSGVPLQIQRKAPTDLFTAIADESTAASLPSTPIVDEAHVRVKRPHSASSDVNRPEKQQRTVNETNNMEKSFNRPSFRAPDNITNARPPYSNSNKPQDGEYRRSSHENHYRSRYDSEYDRPTQKPSSHTWHARSSTADPVGRDLYSEGGKSDARTGAGGSLSSQRRFRRNRHSNRGGLIANVARNILAKQSNTSSNKVNGKNATFTRFGF
jgi:hypothetical protein